MQLTIDHDEEAELVKELQVVFVKIEDVVLQLDLVHHCDREMIKQKDYYPFEILMCVVQM